MNAVGINRHYEQIASLSLNGSTVKEAKTGSSASFIFTSVDPFSKNVVCKGNAEALYLYTTRHQKKTH